jgi:hypothetical protein
VCESGRNGGTPFRGARLSGKQALQKSPSIHSGGQKWMHLMYVIRDADWSSNGKDLSVCSKAHGLAQAEAQLFQWEDSLCDAAHVSSPPGLSPANACVIHTAPTMTTEFLTHRAFIAGSQLVSWISGLVGTPYSGRLPQRHPPSFWPTTMHIAMLHTRFKTTAPYLSNEAHPMWASSRTIRLLLGHNALTRYRCCYSSVWSLSPFPFLCKPHIVDCLRSDSNVVVEHDE